MKSEAYRRKRERILNIAPLLSMRELHPLSVCV